MLLLLIALLVASPGGQLAQPLRVSACEIVSDHGQFFDKLVVFDAYVPQGPHSVFLVAENCPGVPANDLYIGLSYDRKSPALRKFDKLLFTRVKVKNCNDCYKYEVEGTLTGYVRKAPPEGFGFVSAKVGFELIQTSNIRTKKRVIER